ncbi:MAG: class I SAM-dependent methyltransferase [Nitrospirota bacterium]|nr:class I SAM-dependent methyltransferase [Nitrospirota bacterium]
MPDTLPRRLYNRAVRGHLQKRFGYHRYRTGFFDRTLAMLLRLQPGRLAHADARVYHLPWTEGGHVLEVGCGAGETLARLQDYGWQAEGLDFDPGAVERARSRGLKVHQGDLVSQKFPSGHFDAVVLSHVIEHVPDPVELLSECKRVLHPGGHLVIYTPNADSLGHRLFGRDWRGLEPPRHFQIFTLRSLRHTAQAAGLSVRTCKTVPRGQGIVQESLRMKFPGFPAGNGLSVLERILGEAFELLESILLIIQPNAGEEALLIATSEPDRPKHPLVST